MADNQINSDGVLAIFLCVKANVANKLREIDFSVKNLFVSKSFNYNFFFFYLAYSNY